MPSRRRRKSASTAVKLAELSSAVPKVVAHRVARMALAGPEPSARDQREVALMVAEKRAVFSQSWNAMAVQAALANQAMAWSWFKSMWLPGGRRPTAASVAGQIQRAAADVFAEGLAPVHRKAVANAKRLARTKLR